MRTAGFVFLTVAALILAVSPGCDNSPRQEGFCGDGFPEPPEECDDGNNVDGDGCSADCKNEVAPQCGDGIPQAPEQCDDGKNGDPCDGCLDDCTLHSNTCGDAYICGTEKCDDGNNVDGDGCSADCTVEPAPTCGDGTLNIDQGEECDDGNTVNGDGCDHACQYEPVGQTCGDNNPDPLEKCDDGNTQNGDGCNPTCNLTTTVTTLATGFLGDALAVDDTYLWIGTCNPPAGATVCEIQRLDIDACLQSGNCTPQTVAGGACGTPQDGQGTSAVLSCVNTVTTDGSTLWFANQHTVRAMDMQTFDVTTVAGSPNSCAAVDGTGANAYFHDIRGLTYYDGYIYLLDGCEEVLRRLDPADGTVTTIAGTRVPDPTVTQTPPYTCQTGFNCTSNPPADGYGLNAVFGSPRYMTADFSGSLYITDTNGESLRSYNIANGWVGTLVGGSGYQDGQGAAVLLSRPRGLTSDGTSVYFNEQLAHTVRQVIIQTLDTSTMVGIRGCPGSRDGVGGDGSQDWSVPGCGTAPATMPLIDTPMAGITYHFPSRSIFLVEGGNLHRIE